MGTYRAWLRVGEGDPEENGIDPTRFRVLLGLEEGEGGARCQAGPALSEREKGEGKARAGCCAGLPAGPREGEVGSSAGGGARGARRAEKPPRKPSPLFSFFFLFQIFFPRELLSINK